MVSILLSLHLVRPNLLLLDKITVLALKVSVYLELRKLVGENKNKKTEHLCRIKGLLMNKCHFIWVYR